MIKPFKFLNGYTYSDEYTLPLSPDPPFGISRRHWNMMPQDLRDGAHENRIYYMMGWEAARDANYNNPYTDTEPAELWNRGWHAWWERRNRTDQNFNNVNPNPPIDETYPEFYNTDELIFFDVTEVRYDEETYVPYKQMLFRHIEDGNTVEGNRITPEHPMYNFPDII
jgi:hypothetical protein